MLHGQKVAVIGTGNVGATAAYALMLRGLFNEIVLIDSDPALAQAQAADLADADVLARPARVWAGDYADAADARIAVITAGAATHGSEPRLAVAARSAAIVGACVDGLTEAGFAGVILVAANPVDLMSLIACDRSGLPARQVIGTGALLDSLRFRKSLARRLKVSAGSIDGFVVGEHGDSEVAAFSTVRIGALSMDDFAPEGGAIDRAEVAAEVRDAGYRVIMGKGYTSFGIATAIVKICEAIVRDEHTVLPVSTRLHGEYGILDLYLTLPCVIGASGVQRVICPDLSSGEREALQASAVTLREALAGLQSTPAGA